jgi:hypothetical protein
MIIKNINPGVFEIEVTVKEIIYGNTLVDKYIGWDEIESTTLKLKCEDCTVMVFKKDMKLFRNISSGFTFKALVKEWKESIYNFKKLID